MRTFELTHARHDPAYCLVPGLFQNLSKGKRAHAHLNIKYQYGTDEFIEFKALEALGVDDLRILQGLIALAGPKGQILSPSPETVRAATLRDELELRWDAHRANALVVHDSFRRLAKEIGYKNFESGNTYNLIKKSLERLFQVTIFVQKGKTRLGFHLLSIYGSNEDTDNLIVALNPRITEAILGQRPYTRIDMNEVRTLKHDTTRLLHQHLSAVIDPGNSQKFKIETLTSYVWPTAASGSTHRMRTKSIIQALEEISLTKNWMITKTESGLYKIHRKKLQDE